MTTPTTPAELLEIADDLGWIRGMTADDEIIISALRELAAIKAQQPAFACNGCGKPLLPENMLVDDGCPCNTPRGVNFKPRRCELCKADNCVKPAHHWYAIQGFPVAAQQTMGHPSPLPASERTRCNDCHEIIGNIAVCERCAQLRCESVYAAAKHDVASEPVAAQQAGKVTYEIMETARMAYGAVSGLVSLNGLRAALEAVAPMLAQGNEGKEKV